MQITPDKLAKVGPELADLQRARLSRYREQAGLSQQEVADKLGVSRQALQKWEREGSAPEVHLKTLWPLYGIREHYPSAPKDEARRRAWVDARNHNIQNKGKP